LLRASGRDEEAVALEHDELALALSAARIAADGEVEESALLAQENDRVAVASALADLVAPLLVERLRAEIASLAMRAPAAAAAPSAPTANPPPAPARSPGETVPGIADLIDGMLSQQGKAPPSRHSR
jgi:hypothetical protein